MNDKIQIQTEDKSQKERNDFLSKIAKMSGAYNIQWFKEEHISKIIKRKVPTGIKSLDDALNGGIALGSINVIAASSSLGKSTLALQIASNTMKTIPTIYVSLEMDKTQVMAKLLSAKLAEKGIDDINKTSDELLNENILNIAGYHRMHINDSIASIQQEAKDLYVYQPNDNKVTIDSITSFVESYIKYFKKTPLIIIDYMQIMSAPNNKKIVTDKQIIDDIMSKVRIMAMKYNIPFIIISSLNRDGYNKKVSLEHLKESGNIEFGADTIIGMNFDFSLIDKDEKGKFDLEKAKSVNPRKIELEILKNRYGAVNDRIKLDYYCKYNYFVDKGKASDVAKAKRRVI